MRNGPRRIPTLALVAALLVGALAAVPSAAQADTGVSPACREALGLVQLQLEARPYAPGEALALVRAEAAAPCDLVEEPTLEPETRTDLDVRHPSRSCSGPGLGTIGGFVRILGVTLPLATEPAAGDMHGAASFAHVHAEGITLGLHAMDFGGAVRVGPGYVATPEAGAGVSCGWGFSPFSWSPVACHGAGAARLFGGSALEFTVYAHLSNPLPCWGYGGMEVDFAELAAFE